MSDSKLLPLQSKHPHVLYEYKDNTPQGCAVPDNSYSSGGYERGKRSSVANLLPIKETAEAEAVEARDFEAKDDKEEEEATANEHEADPDEKVKRDVRSVAKFIEVALVLDKAMFDKRPHSSRKDVIHDAIQVANIADLVRPFIFQNGTCFVKKWFLYA